MWGEKANRAIIIATIGKTETEVVAGFEERGIYSHHLSLGSQEMDKAVIEHFQNNLGLLIGERTAEEIRIILGSALPGNETLTMDVRGRDVEKKEPRTVTVTEVEISAAISEVVVEIVDEIQAAVDRLSAVSQAALANCGIVIKGEGGWLRGLDKRLFRETNLPVIVSDEIV